MGKGGGTEQTTQDTDPWIGYQPYIKDIASQAQTLYQDYTPEAYGGPQVAGFAPQQTAGMGMQEAFAQGGGANLLNQGLGAAGYGLGGSILDVANNPYVSGMAQAAAQKAYDPLTQQLAGIRGGAVRSGGYGGSRQGIAEGTALSGAHQNAINAAANIYGQAYGQGLGHQAQTMGQIPSLMTTGFGLGGGLSNVGQQQQALAQQEINAAIGQHDWQQQLPYTQLSQYANVFNPLSSFGGGHTTTTQPAPSTSPFQTIMGLASIASGMPPGTFSDHRLKTKIKKVGELPSGLNLYQWSWNDEGIRMGADSYPTTGVIAQEAREIYPDAVTKGMDGYLRVDYSQVH